VININVLKFGIELRVTFSKVEPLLTPQVIDLTVISPFKTSPITDCKKCLIISSPTSASLFSTKIYLNCGF
jgi:hypothetical protein